MLSFIREKSVWNRLQSESRPIVLYGMGDGAEKILRVCKERGISVSGVFASDEFVRGQVFCGYPVRTLAQTEAVFGDIVILLAFGSFLPEVMERIISISERHTLYAPDVPLFGGGLWDEGYLETHEDEIGKAYSLLADEQSRVTFADVLNYRLSGKLSYLSHCETEREEMYRLLQIGAQEDYFDLGAYDGDTVREFLSFTKGHFRSVTAVEPDPKNRKKLLRKCPQFLSDSRFALVEAGVWHEDGELHFDNAAGRNSALSPEGKILTPVLSLDSIVGERDCSFIKMDVEGAEREALLGGSRTLRDQRPQLLFSAYHKTEDIYSLPLLLHALQPQYRIYFRHQPYFPAWETNFCASSK